MQTFPDDSARARALSASFSAILRVSALRLQQHRSAGHDPADESASGHERFDTPVMLRSTTSLSHTRSQVALGERLLPPSREFREELEKNVMIPAYARARHPRVLEREQKLASYFDTAGLARVESSQLLPH